MTTSTLFDCLPRPRRCAWLLLLLLTALAVPQVQGFDFINVTSVVPTAQESTVASNIRDGVVLIARSGDTTADLVVTFAVTSVDNSYNSYTVASSGVLAFSYTNTVSGQGSGTVTIPAGIGGVTVSIVPIDNNEVDGAELVNVIISPDPSNNYDFNGNPEASVVVAEGDLTLTASLPVSVAYKQQIPGFLFDSQSARRGVIAATFNTPTLGNELASSPFPEFLPTFPAVPAEITSFMGAQFSGTAVVASDYNLTYRITGITPTTTGSPLFTPTTAWTVETPGPGYGTSRTGSTATGYDVVAYLRGTQGPIAINTPAQVVGGVGQTAIEVGDFITFSDDPASNYKVTSLTGGLFIEYGGLPGIGLQSNLHNGSSITDVGQTNVVGYMVTAPYGTGTTQIRVENGFNGFHYGDAFQINGNTPVDTAFYVCTGFTFNSYVNAASQTILTSDGTVTFEPYANASLGGLNVAIAAADLAILTEFPLTLSGNGETGSIIMPSRSTQIQFGITPIDSGVPTGMRAVTAQLIGNNGFNLVNPAQATVEIADDSSIASINSQADATSPNVGGSFLVTFTNAFPVAVAVPYTVIAGPGTPANIGTDYIISGLTALPGSTQIGYGSVVLPAGAKSVTIPVTPISSLVTPETVTLSLTPSLDYLLSSGTTTSINPTATINILPSLGTIGVTATTTPGTTPTMSIAATAQAAPANCGMFTITNAGGTPATVPILVNFAISSTATLGIDYQILDSNLNILTPSGGSNPNFQATIPANGSSVVVYVQPLYDPAAETSFTISAAIVAGQAYQQSSTQASLSVVVVPQTVTAAAIGDASVSAAALTTNFTITSTNPGSPVTVAFSFPNVTGDATYGTDFTATFNPSNIVTAGTTPGTFTATLGASGTLSIELVGLADPSATYPLAVNLVIASGNGYQLVATPNGSVLTNTVPPTLAMQVNLQQNSAVLAGENKPTPGLYNTGSGGCGNGSGFATLFSLTLATIALTVVRRRRRG